MPACPDISMVHLLIKAIAACLSCAHIPQEPVVGVGVVGVGVVASPAAAQKRYRCQSAHSLPGEVSCRLAATAVLELGKQATAAFLAVTTVW
jgi:hypothetical protein